MMKEFHNHEWWLPYIDECRSMHITLREYCRMKGFNYNTYYRHWQVENSSTQINQDCETQIYPVVIAGAENNVKHIEINGVEVSGSTEDLRDLLGIML